jgi:hypothetical protein
MFLGYKCGDIKMNDGSIHNAKAVLLYRIELLSDALRNNRSLM